jgi:hypothetical protein
MIVRLFSFLLLVQAQQQLTYIYHQVQRKVKPLLLKMIVTA